MDYPFHRLYIEGLRDRYEYMQMLDDGSEIIPKLSTERTRPSGERLPDRLVIEIPGIEFSKIDPVIEVFLKDAHS